MTVFLTIVLQSVNGFIVLEEEKDYLFVVEWEDKGFIPALSQPMERFFHGDMFVRKLDSNNLLFRLENVTSERHASKEELELPFKAQIEDFKIQNITTMGNWTEKGIKMKYDLIEEFVKDYSDMTNLLDSRNWNNTPELELPMGLCKPKVTIVLEETQINIVAEAKKTNCQLSADVLFSVGRGFDVSRSLSDDSENGVKVIVDRSKNSIKEIEGFADLEMYIEPKNLRVVVKTRLNFEYIQVLDDIEEVPFENNVVCFYNVFRKISLF